MSLLDHFQPPLFPTRRWQSFHGFWAAALGESLNVLLPRRYYAEIHTHTGTDIEADVAEFEQRQVPAEQEVNGPAGGVALQTYAPPSAVMTMPAVFPDDLEVQVYDTRDGATLVGVVELVSPANKDRPESRRAFASKCAAYLQRGLGVVVVDIVTVRRFNLHDELVRVMGLDAAFIMPPETFLYAVAYRPVHREAANQIDVWPNPLAVGQTLPVLPLGLRGGPLAPVDLEATYLEASQRAKL
jgi:hypothetical protein